MIVDNRITEYLHSLETSRGELLDTIEKKAIEDGVPIIRIAFITERVDLFSVLSDSDSIFVTGDRKSVV